MASAREILLYMFIFILGWLGFLVVKPFASYIILAFLFAFLFYPVYAFLKKFMWDGAASVLVLFIVLLCIVLPAVYLTGTLLSQASDAYQSFQASGVSPLDEENIASMIERWTGMEVFDQVVEIFDQGRELLKDAIPGIITSTGVFLIGLFIMFFVLYFALREGPTWFERAGTWLPVAKKRRAESMMLLKRQARALIYGQILTSILLGIVVGLLLWFFGIPNVIFLSFVTIILGIIPVVGAFLVYVPAGLYLIWNDAWIAGVLLIVLSTAAQIAIDHILRPKFVSKASEIHPIFVVIGALGGIILLGVVGFLVGPLILSFFFVLMNENRTN